MAHDELTNQYLESVFPDVAVRWRRVAEDMFKIYGMRLKATSGYRSTAEQWAIYGKGRKKTKDGIWHIVAPEHVVSYAEPLQSLHNYGLALDTAFYGDDPYLEKIIPTVKGPFLWNEFGRFAKAHGLEWGGDWQFHQDRPHVQMRYGMSVRELKEIYIFGGLKGVFHKCEKILKGEKV